MKRLLATGLLFPLLSFATPITNSEPPAQLSPYAPWETIQSPDWDIKMERMSVPHGWMVITYSKTTTTTIFVPDENHEWIL